MVSAKDWQSAIPKPPSDSIFDPLTPNLLECGFAGLRLGLHELRILVVVPLMCRENLSRGRSGWRDHHARTLAETAETTEAFWPPRCHEAAGRARVTFKGWTDIRCSYHLGLSLVGGKCRHLPQIGLRFTGNTTKPRFLCPSCRQSQDGYGGKALTIYQQRILVRVSRGWRSGSPATNGREGAVWSTRPRGRHGVLFSKLGQGR